MEKEKKPNVRFDVERAVRADTNPDLTPQARLVLYALATFADPRGAAHPSQATLATACGWASSSSVREGLAKAKALGYVRVHQGGDGRPAMYCMTIPGTMCGHERLRAESARRNPADLNVEQPAGSEFQPAGSEFQPAALAQQPAGFPAHNIGEHVEQIKENKYGQISGGPEVETSEIVSAAIRREFSGMPDDLVAVLRACAVELLGGDRDGLVNWRSDKGVTYDALLDELRDMTSPQELRELIEELDR